MTWPAPLMEFLRANGLGEITHQQPVSGGCINDGRIIVTSSEEKFFLKQNLQAPEGLFAREAEGLQAIAQAPGAPRVPQPRLHTPTLLLLEYLAPAPAQPRCWEIFGAQMAHLHLCTAPRFGFDHDNYIGSTPQPNPWTEDGYAFYAGQRLLFQANLARRNGLLPASDERLVEQLAARLPQHIPNQPVSLLHGDLWSGNIHIGPGGLACLVDPAAYFGWAEADLAMTDLFGHLPAAFYEAYQSLRPLEQGYRQRYDLYNLYHLLNHLNLFGLGYLRQIQLILQRYA